MLHQLKNLSVIIALTALIQFQSAAQDSAWYIWKPVVQGKKDPNINFLPTLTLKELPDQGELRSFSLPLVKFNQGPPRGKRVLIKSPTKEVFENNAFTLMEEHVM